MTESHNQSPQTQGAFQPGAIVFDRFEILDFISKGAKGRVYKAQDTLLQNVVALKVLFDNRKSDKDYVRFQTEARLASKMKHPNIATVFDFGLSDGTPFLSMEYVEGESLQTILDNNNTIALPDFYEIFIQVCAALVHAHRHGIVHRDITPANIVLAENPQGGFIVKLLDFGLAKELEVMQEEGGKLTPTGNILGSPFYMSPEQCRGMPVTAKSDNYSLGCVMWHCLVGKPPFEGETAMETLWHHANTDPGSILEFGENQIPDRLCDLIGSLMSKTPEERASLGDTAIVVLESLACQEEEATTPSAPDVDTTSGGAPAPGETTKSLKGWVVAGATAAVAAAAIAAVITSESQKAFEPLSDSIQGGTFIEYVDNQFDSHYRKMRRAARVGKSSSVSLRYNFTDHHVKELGVLPHNVYKLDLSDSPVTDRVILYLRQIPGLIDLTLNRSRVSTLAHLAEHAPNLMTLHCKKTRIDDNAIKQIAMLKHLKTLGIDECFNITEKGIAELAAVPNLTDLNISSTKISAKVVPAIKKLSNLRHLKMQNTDINLAAVRQIMSMPTLQSIDVSNCKNLSDSQVEQLAEDFPTISVQSRVPVSVELENAAGVAFNSGDFKAALHLYKRKVSLLEKRFGPDSESLIQPLNCCGVAAASDHRMKEANRYFERAIRIAERHKRDGDLLLVLTTQCDMNAAFGDPESAIALYEKLLKLEERLNGSNTRTMAERTFIQGNLYRGCGQYANAQRMYQKSAAIRDRVFGPKSFQKADVLMHMGECYRSQEKMNEADALYQESAAILEQNELDDAARSTLFVVYAGRSAAAHWLRKYDSSKEFNDKALELSKTHKVPPFSLSVLLKQRAELLEAMGLREEAQSAHAEANRLRELAKKKAR